MRGLLRNLVTRLYFPEEPSNLTDPILQLVPGERRPTLIAQAGSKPGTLHWDIVMQQQEANAKPETVFFAW
jgi:protocatechuate 3,4-dioxygenase alpha subunit